MTEIEWYERKTSNRFHVGELVGELRSEKMFLVIRRKDVSSYQDHEICTAIPMGPGANSFLVSHAVEDSRVFE